MNRPRPSFLHFLAAALLLAACKTSADKAAKPHPNTAPAPPAKNAQREAELRQKATSLIAGMTANQVLDLLGPPLKTSITTVADPSGQPSVRWVWSYEIFALLFSHDSSGAHLESWQSL